MKEGSSQTNIKSFWEVVIILCVLGAIITGIVKMINP